MTLRFCCLRDTPDNVPGPQFVFDGPAIEAYLDCCAAVILTEGDEQRAATLLEAGVPLLLIGEAALRDSEVLTRLAERFGNERIGLQVPVRRLAVDWSFETVSNADFKVVTPSLCAPTWEVLFADGSGSGTHADWWIGQMLERGAQCVLLRADIDSDDDLNLCAGLQESLGDHLWVAPLALREPSIEAWVEFGQVRQLALPPELFDRREVWQSAPPEIAATDAPKEFA
ncbi:MAG: hypothetical protein CVU34_08670 [Betaproteobacteria bacterium HGW-Betaproteobacteria-7]|jgi:hypothetical protein|nr:MAG: hypothetical protein CVU34_08670 [Betaproteobacteria bacterium HGW-Betaproteobacteria-7]